MQTRLFPWPPNSAFLDLLWIIRLPFSFLWWAFTSLKRSLYLPLWRQRFPLKVVSVGNLHSGGSGKTPLVLEVARYLKKHSPVIVSRGYLSRENFNCVQVNPHDTGGGAARFGDEPWMMAHLSNFPVWIGRHRVQSLSLIDKKKHSCAILDDAFQHFPVSRDLDLICINAARDPWDSHCLPLGDLREGWEALRKAHAVIIVVDEESQAEKWKEFLPDRGRSLSIFLARRAYDPHLWQGSRSFFLAAQDNYGAFCGVGNSESFERAVKQYSQIHFLKSFPDHHAYSDQDLDPLVGLAKEKNLKGFVTTDKDYFKVAPLFSLRREALLSLRIRYELGEDFWYFLKSRLELY